MEDLEGIQAELATRDDDLIAQENIYIASKEALALERNEVTSLHKALAKEQDDHALTKKTSAVLNQKYCDLDKKHKELELQYSLLWDSTSNPSKAKDAYTPSTSQGCGKCFNLDLNIYATNLANMEVMRKEIARLNEIIAAWCMKDKTQDARKKIVSGFKFVQFERREKFGTVQPAQTAVVPHPKDGSAAPHKNRKATNLSPDQTKLIMKKSRQNSKAPKAIKVQHQPKKTLVACFKCKKEGHHVKDCTLKKEEKSMSKIQEKKKKKAHVKSSGMGHNAFMCSKFQQG